VASLAVEVLPAPLVPVPEASPLREPVPAPLLLVSLVPTPLELLVSVLLVPLVPLLLLVSLVRPVSELEPLRPDRVLLDRVLLVPKPAAPLELLP